MAGRWLVLAVWAAASGCVVSVGDRPTPAPPAAADAPPREFASIRSLRPGEFQPDDPVLSAAVPPKPAELPLPAPPLYTSAQLVSAPVPPDSPAVSAVRSLEAGRPADPDGLPPGVLPLLASAVQVGRAAGPAAIGEAIRQLDQAAAALAPQAPLQVTKAVFCRDVKGFGLYDPLPQERPVYPAAKKPTVNIYLELRNVALWPVGDQFLWQPRATWVVRDAGGAVVDQRTQVLRREPVRTPTRDNHVWVWFAAPERPGSYIVTVGVAEPGADGRVVSREVSKQLSFTVK